MNSTGMVRRIDDLGRIVIPKEVRRTLRLREGDGMEIFVNSEEGIVIFKKYNENKVYTDHLTGLIEDLTYDGNDNREVIELLKEAKCKLEEKSL
jgi:transcriptional pleiotropic regulator of transition state genes